MVANEAWFLTVFKSTGVHPLNICKGPWRAWEEGNVHPRVAESMGKGVQPLTVSAGPSQE